MKPKLISIGEEGSFAHSTLVNRFPKIINNIIDQNIWRPDVIRSLKQLLDSIPNEMVRHMRNEINDDAAYWNRYISSLPSTKWLDLPFYEAEAIFYRLILDCINYSEENPLDPFLSEKKSSFDSRKSDLRELADVVSSEGIKDIGFTNIIEKGLNLSLWGNKADMSLFKAEELQYGSNDRLLINDIGAFVKAIDAYNRPVNVDIVLDNSGAELVGDLALIDILLRTQRVNIVRVHCKPHPFFVSDATLADFDKTLTWLSYNADAKVRSWSNRLRELSDHNHLKKLTHPFWCHPRFMTQMPQDLASILNEAEFIIIKGDANYRRYVEDRHWPVDYGTKSLRIPSLPPTLALRILKSELIVGYDTEKAVELDRTDPHWLTNGNYGMAQFFL
jgi:uncharacterized protein with ATP-grasp and redox domains